MMELLEHDTTTEADDLVHQELVTDILSMLPEREAYVLQRCFGLTDGGVKLKLREIGAELSVSSTRVAQIRNQALKKIRQHSSFHEHDLLLSLAE